MLGLPFRLARDVIYRSGLGAFGGSPFMLRLELGRFGLGGGLGLDAMPQLYVQRPKRDASCPGPLVSRSPRVRSARGG